ncbi:MAG TPA: sigma-70 family RNA polymerase sigma factor [Polyangiales bacterium]
MTSDPSDVELLERWRQGEKAAGSALLRRHFATLHRFFRSKAYGSEEDLMQATFMACMEPSRFQGVVSFRAYLLGIARNQLLMHYRKTARDERIDLTSKSVHDLRTSPSGAARQRQEHELLARALEQIPVDQQIALELAYWDDLSAPEIAVVLEIPENTVYSRLNRAKQHLRDALARLSADPEQREGALNELWGPRTAQRSNT